MDTLNTLSVEAKEFYDRTLLYRAQQAQVYYNFGRKPTHPKRSGDKISWRRFNALSLATTELTEGVTPVESQLSVTEVRATAKQYGNYVRISDKLDLLGYDPVITESTMVLGQNAGESVEAIIRDVLAAGTNVIYATGSARSSVGTANILTLDLLRKGLRNLQVNNTMAFAGPEQNNKFNQGTFTCIVHPNVMWDLTRDTTLQNTFQNNANNSVFFDGQLAKIWNINFYQSTLAPVFAGAGSGGANVYGCLLFGENAFGVVDVAGTGKFETIVKPVGSAGADDPLDQRGSVGWKAYQAPIILNNNFMVRIEVGATES